MRLKAQSGFRAVAAALVLRDKGGLRLSEAKQVVDALSDGLSVSLSLTASPEVVDALRACRVTVKAEREAARA